MNNAKVSSLHPNELWLVVLASWPNARKDRPLAIGVGKDLRMALMSHGLSSTAAGRAIAFWCRSFRYLRSQVAGADRFDLTGAVSGVVTEREATYAANKLAACRSAKKALKARRSNPAAAEGEAVTAEVPAIAIAIPRRERGKGVIDWKPVARLCHRAPPSSHTDLTRKAGS